MSKRSKPMQLVKKHMGGNQLTFTPIINNSIFILIFRKPWNSFSNKFVQPPLLRKYNNKGAFEIWSVVAIVCAVGVSLSWRPAGTASQLRRSIQYAIPALIVTHPWGEVCMNSIRAMTIKQGIAVRAILC